MEARRQAGRRIDDRLGDEPGAAGVHQLDQRPGEGVAPLVDVVLACDTAHRDRRTLWPRVQQIVDRIQGIEQVAEHGTVGRHHAPARRGPDHQAAAAADQRTRGHCRQPALAQRCAAAAVADPDGEFARAGTRRNGLGAELGSAGRQPGECHIEPGVDVLHGREAGQRHWMQREADQPGRPAGRRRHGGRIQRTAQAPEVRGIGAGGGDG